jgi:hypothetical protein
MNLCELRGFVGDEPLGKRESGIQLVGSPLLRGANIRLPGTFAMMLLASSLFKLMEVLSILFIFGVGSTLLLLAIVFALDRRQTRDTIVRNYPVIGHMRHVLSKLDEFLRQYFFAMDRDELPFNRAERNWVESSSKNADPTIAFGSIKYIREVGTPIFVNCPYPTLEALTNCRCRDRGSRLGKRGRR